MDQKHAKEEYVIILDFLSHGYPFGSDQRKLPIAQALGKDNFRLLELIPKKGINLQPGQEVYVGEGKREEIHHIIGKLKYDKLTHTAQAELEFILKKIVENHEPKFIAFFNEAGPINLRRHYLQLLPGVGKKHMWEIIEKRKEQFFTSFKDIKGRVKLLPDPEKLIIKRIILELQDADNYKIFTG